MAFTRGDDKLNSLRRKKKMKVLFVLGVAGLSIVLCYQYVYLLASVSTITEVQSSSRRAQADVTASSLSSTNREQRLDDFASVTEEVQALHQEQPRKLREDNFWQNDFNVVHILQTRFMQKQPNLLHLGRARIELFRHVCLPSIVRQSTRQFLWIIRFDPDLHAELKQSLVELTENVPIHIVLLADNHYPDGFRTMKFPKNMFQLSDKNYELLQSYHHAAQSRVVLESRLDSDDGLSSDYMLTLQKQQQQAALPTSSFYSSSSWKVFCVASLIEWQYINPFVVTDDNSKEEENGFFIDLPQDNFCVSTGLTWVYGINSKPQDRTVGAHDKVFALIPPCQDKNNSTNCRTMVQTNKTSIVQAIRARTPTSAGLTGVVLKPFASAKKEESGEEQILWRNHQQHLQTLSRQYFGISNTVKLRRYLKQHMVEIVTDAIDGHCTIPGTCHVEIKKVLQVLLSELNNQAK